jgi:electron transport complex protein RnfB
MSEGATSGPAAPETPIGRRRFLRRGAAGLAALAAGGLCAAARRGGQREPALVWQIDPDKCVQCGQCATHCVLNPSAVKCVHAFPVCGYCKRCFGYFQPDAERLTSAAENQLCPTGALRRRHVEGFYYEYTIDEDLCVGCGKCVKGCTMYGNGSLYLQIMGHRCVNCNECAIARSCPADAIQRVRVARPYLLKGRPEAPST